MAAPTTPSVIQHSSAEVLEFAAMREMIRGYASSSLGQIRATMLAPSRERTWIDRQQQLTAEIREFLRVGGSFEFGGLSDPSQSVEKARIQGVALEIGDLREVLVIIERAAAWREIAIHPSANLKDWTAAQELSSGIEDFTELLRYFRNKLLPDGTLDDRASPELARIRREIEKQKRHIQESLRGYLRKLAEGGAVQDELITIRGERFVIPVKTEQKRRVNGVVHGASSSGQTVFVEPLETIEQNNELVRLMEEELAEVHRLLLEMTRRIGERAQAILRAVEILGALELQFAKARFANDYRCIRVKLLKDLSEDSLVLRNSRHPLLERNLRAKKQEVVPLSVELDRGHRQVIISGPNTGGKTVGLKTIGLFALMAQSGIPVPADRAEMPIFDAVLADIGDYQSIEQNLSTFSAHVTNIDFITSVASGDSLVLLDELGSATDPEEGAALAVAIADHFRRAGCVSVISTHHTSLKVYAANTAGVLNAAVGFDERTLQPTYELRVGVPGASAGINIAQRLGLKREIVDSARARLGSQAQDVAKFLDRLHSELRELSSERAGLAQREQELQRERKRLEAEGLKEERERVREMERKLDSLIRDFEFRARETVNAVQDRAAALKLSKDAERRIAKLRREFREQFDHAVVAHRTGADVGDPDAQPQVVKQITEGDTVRLKSFGRSGLVTRQIDGNTFEVEVGAMKMRIPRDDVAEVIARASDNPVKAARARGINVRLKEENLTSSSEINVIGRTVDDATREVEKFVDRAFLAGLPRVRVVHGSGMGILRKALREFLRRHPHVATVAEPPQNEGGAGATVVDLKT